MRSQTIYAANQRPKKNGPIGVKPIGPFQSGSLSGLKKTALRERRFFR